ncbi:hypothetical protein [Antrihabitans cavernicola]|uniref:3-hydroxyacyl-CoA dehydrogenase n=1 Tax=Antrihabitans cavernicola TaxID=2495913 RepID=A0A5A7SGM2_9NOCA|nr:hypothetical protein [Spelaeibacter cavernicola]KAA0023361.1 hypothetical protein FOY51_08090 [Spelaeibacter cavernicola]
MTEQLLVLHPGSKAILALGTDGSRIRPIVEDLPDVPDGIVVDHVRGQLYWTNMGTPDSSRRHEYFTRNGSLERMNLDGSERRTILPMGSFTTGKQLTADFDNATLYWCDREGMQVLRCNLDGSDLEPLVVVAEGDDAAHEIRNQCVGIAIDTANGFLYWTQKGAPKAGEGRIFRAGLEIPAGETAANRSDIETLWSGLPEPIDLELAAGGSVLMWTDRGAEPDGNTLNRARVLPEVGTPEIVARGFRETIALASADERTYYVTDLHGAVRSVDVEDGTTELIAELGPGLTGIALADF